MENTYLLIKALSTVGSKRKNTAIIQALWTYRVKTPNNLTNISCINNSDPLCFLHLLHPWSSITYEKGEEETKKQSAIKCHQPRGYILVLFKYI